jgi:hypothetical protein
MKRLRNLQNRVFLFILVLFLPLFGFSQLGHRKINQLDEKGRRQGRWITWQDSARRLPSCKSWYKDGIESRTTRYYHSNGNTRLKFCFKGDSLIVVRYFDPQGKLTDKGSALRLFTDTEIRYCWDGEWKQYDKRHRVVQRMMYRKGEEVP